WTPQRRQELLRRAGRACDRAVRVSRTFRNDLPHALREAGLVAAMRGDVRRARACLDESLADARQQGAKFEHAPTQLAWGRGGMDLGWPNAQGEAEAARQALRALGADFALDETPAPEAREKHATLSLIDRFDTVLDAGRRIASALERKTIFAEVRDAAARLLRGERCLLLEHHADAEELTTASDEVGASYSRAMAQRALQTGRVVVFPRRPAH